MTEEKQVLFYVGSEIYGIGINEVQGIEKYTNIIPVPNAPSYVDGIINLRGDIIPVFSLRNKFGLSEVPPTNETKLIVAKSRDATVAFQVDAVSEIVTLDEKSISVAPPMVHSSKTGYIASIAYVNDKLVILINLDGVLTEQERCNIDAIREKTEEEMK